MQNWVFKLVANAAVTLLLCQPVNGQDSPVSFSRDIRPILNDKCFACHGPDENKLEAGLKLDNRDSATMELDSGERAIVPGDSAASELFRRVTESDEDLRMPPADSAGRLSKLEIKKLKDWIEAGAKYEAHWAFVPPQRPTVPAVQNSTWPRNPIDHFVLAKLEQAGLKPAAEANRPTLIRRLALDLTGLPPSISELDEFLGDESTDAYEKLVDRLMASPNYGERLALPWLDAARYADSNGFQQDGDTWQWIWRDWVVRAINDDMPFDQFSIWQLAGDLLPDATTDQKVASAFNRNHLLNGEGGAIAEEQRFVGLFDRIDTTATNWLGLTMACAQCHDHKYDPITQRDYYSLIDAFNRVPESGAPQFFSTRIRVDAPFIELPTDENNAMIADLETKIKTAEEIAAPISKAAFEGWRIGLMTDGKLGEGKELPEPILTILAKPESERSKEEAVALDAGLKKHFNANILPKLVGSLAELAALEELRKQVADYKKDQLPRVMVMSDGKPRETHILSRGAYLSPMDKVSFATPDFLPPMMDGAPRNRLGFAQWLFAPENPLTARVQVNRMWQYLFGTGLVKTPEDFGVQSEYPVHDQLLDWLAVEFRARGWSMKQIHRLILTSATYRQSSRVTADHLSSDAENRLLARSSRLRIPALVLRDWALASASLLDPRIGGKPVYPYQPDGIWEALAITKERDFTYPASSGNDLYRRSLYTFWRRTVGPANMFDGSNRQTCRVRTATTNTPLHALTTLNDPTWVEAARVLAENSWRSAADLDGRITTAFRRVLCRVPSDLELVALRRTFERQLAIYQADTEAAKALLEVGAASRNMALDDSEQAAMSATCLAILNLDEAVTRE